MGEEENLHALICTGRPDVQPTGFPAFQGCVLEKKKYPFFDANQLIPNSIARKIYKFSTNFTISEVDVVD